MLGGSKVDVLGPDGQWKVSLEINWMGGETNKGVDV